MDEMQVRAPPLPPRRGEPCASSDDESHAISPPCSSPSRWPMPYKVTTILVLAFGLALVRPSLLAWVALYVSAAFGAIQVLVVWRAWTKPTSAKLKHAASRRPAASTSSLWQALRERRIETAHHWQSMEPMQPALQERLFIHAVTSIGDRAQGQPASTAASPLRMALAESLQPVIRYAIHRTVVLVDRVLAVAAGTSLSRGDSLMPFDMTLVRVYNSAMRVLVERCHLHQQWTAAVRSASCSEEELPSVPNEPSTNDNKTRTNDMKTPRTHAILCDGAMSERRWLRTFVDHCWRHLMRDPRLCEHMPVDEIVRVLVREWMVGTLLQPAIDRLCRPTLINRHILEYTTRRMMEQRLASQFRETLELIMAFPPREFTTLSDWRSRTPAPFADRLRYAESLYKSVKRCRSVVDAKNVRFALAMEIRRVDRAADGARSGDVSGSMASSAAVYPGNATTGMSEAMQRYLRQLHVTKQKYEKRIFVLSTEASDNGGNNVERRADSKATDFLSTGTPSTLLPSPTRHFLTIQRNLTGSNLAGSQKGSAATLLPATTLDLRTMLAESHHKKASENLFYFLQFMERAGIGRKVQFWLDVERVRVNYGPLLNPNDGGGDVQHPGRDTNERELQLLDEIQRIHDTYLLYTDNIIQLHPKTHFAIKQLIGHYSNAESVATSVLSPAAQSRPDSPALITPTDRLCIVAAQEEVLRDMEANDFPAFLQSDSYFRWLADQERHQPEMAVDGDGGDEALSSTTTPQHGVTESTRASRQSGPFDAPTYNHGGSNMSDASAGASPINGGKLVASQTTISPEQRMDLDFNSADIMQMLKRNLRNILADTSVANAKEMYMHSTQPTRSTSSPYCPNSPVTASTSDRSRRSPSRALADLFSPSSSTRPSAVLNDISPFSELMVALDQAIDEGNGTTKSSSSPDAPPLNTSTSTARPADWSDLLDALLFQISLIEHMLKKDVGRSGFFDGVAACLERLEYADDATGSISTTARSEMLARLVRRVLARTRETLRRELAEILEKKMVVDRMDESEAVQLSKWRVSVVPAGAKSADAVFFLEVFCEEAKTGLPTEWVVPRRFSEFQALHQRLRELRPSTHEYAGKLFSSRVTWHRSKKELVQERQRGLELYLNRLLNDPALAQNGMLRNFLSDHATNSSKKTKLFRKNSSNLIKLLESNDGTPAATASASSAAVSPAVQRLEVPRPIPSLSVSVSSPDHTGSGQSLTAAGSSLLSTSFVPRVTVSALTSSDANHPLMTQSPLDSPRALSPASTGEGGLDVAPRAVRVRPTRAASMSPTPSSTEFSDNESVAGERWRSLSDAGTSATAIDDSMSVSAEQAAASAFIMSNRSTTSISESPSRYTPAATATNTSDEFSTSFAQPLCQMMLALFDFQEQNPLLQESAALLLVKQGLLGHQPQMSADEQLESRFREAFTWNGVSWLVDRVIAFVGSQQTSTASTSPVDDISGEELKVKLEARGRLLHVLPDAFVRLLGYDDAASGLRRCFEMVQSYDKNKELVYAVLLAVMDALDGGMDT